MSCKQHGLGISALLLALVAVGLSAYNFREVENLKDDRATTSGFKTFAGRDVDASKRLSVKRAVHPLETVLAPNNGSYVLVGVNETFNAVQYNTDVNSSFVTLFTTITLDVNGSGGADLTVIYTPDTEISAGYVAGVPGQSSGTYVIHDPLDPPSRGTARTMIIESSATDPLAFSMRTTEVDSPDTRRLTLNLQLVFNTVTI